MLFKFEQRRVVFEGSNFVIYDVCDLLPKHKNYPHGTDVIKPNGKRAIPAHWKYGPRGQAITAAFVHQTAGSYSPGFAGLYNTAAFIVRDPDYDENGKWLGNGRGWPAMCYSYYFCYEPDFTPEGKLIIYKCRPDPTKSWHTAGHNGPAIAFGFQGYFFSRHMGKFRARKGDKTNGKPSMEQMVMLTCSWDEYYKPTFNLTDKDLFGHFEAKRPKPQCPGEFLETHILTTRGENDVVVLPSEPGDPARPDGDFSVPLKVPLELPDDAVELDDWKRRQGALLILGYNLGDYGPNKNGVDGDPGLKTRAAIEGVEESLGLTVNGVWDDRLEYLIQLMLFAFGTQQRELDELSD